MRQEQCAAMQTREAELIEDGATVGVMDPRPVFGVLLHYPFVSPALLELRPEMTNALVTRIATNWKHRGFRTLNV
jgi:hypothetical protein